jgi:hypothetical protein
MSRLLLRRVGYIQALQVEGTVSHKPWKEHFYRNTRRLSKFEGAEVMDYGVYPAQFTKAVLEAYAQRIPFTKLVNLQLLLTVVTRNVRLFQDL